MAVSKRTRYEVLKRDNHTCRYCGATAPDAKITVDHVVPVSLGGSDDPSNIVTACQDCNAGKASSNPDAPLVEDVKQDALRWASAMREAVSVRAAQRVTRDAYAEEFHDFWTNHKWASAMPSDWGSTIWQFYDAGLPKEDLRESAVLALTNPKLYGDESIWRYFCGCAWKRLTALQEVARDLLAVQEGDE